MLRFSFFLLLYACSKCDRKRCENMRPQWQRKSENIMKKRVQLWRMKERKKKLYDREHLQTRVEGQTFLPLSLCIWMNRGDENRWIDCREKKRKKKVEQKHRQRSLPSKWFIFAAVHSLLFGREKTPCTHLLVDYLDIVRNTSELNKLYNRHCHYKRIWFKHFFTWMHVNWRWNCAVLHLTIQKHNRHHLLGFFSSCLCFSSSLHFLFSFWLINTNTYIWETNFFADFKSLDGVKQIK